MQLTASIPTTSTDKPLIIAHRGASSIAPENTLAAMEQAINEQADGWEIDVHLSKDGRVMVIHDESTSRTCGTSMTVAATLSDDLRKLDAGCWKDPKYSEQIPFLEEVLELLPSGKLLFIEIKSGVETVEPVARLMEASGKLQQLRVITFHGDVAEAMKIRMPQTPVYYLRSPDKDKATRKPLPFTEALLRNALERRLDGVDVNYGGITPDFVRRATALNLEVHAWTVDEPKEARRLRDLGVKSITTNKPALIRTALQQP